MKQRHSTSHAGINIDASDTAQSMRNEAPISDASTNAPPEASPTQALMARTQNAETPPIRDETVPFRSPQPGPAPRPTTSMRYTAVWEPSRAGEIQMYDVTYEEYRANYDQLWSQGWRLKSLQPTVAPGNKVRYTAVWEQSTAGEIQVYGWTYEDYRKKYDELWKQGWRLKIIQPFVLSKDQVRYTAVWEQSTAGEIQVYGWTYEDYRKKYDELWGQGWRLKMIRPFVLSGNQIRYTAVWQQSTAGEIQVYGWSYVDYRAKYDELWQQGWRLKSLQTFISRVPPPKIKVPPPSHSKMVDRAVQAYKAAGGLNSEVGYPVEPVRVTGREAFWKMSGGSLVATDDGSWRTQVDEVVKVWFVGFQCFEESGEFSSSDEPYFVASYAVPGRSVTKSYTTAKINKGQIKIFDDVIVHDMPVKTGRLHIAVYEHDEGSVKEAREKVAKAMQDIAAAGAQAAAIIDASQAAAGNASNVSTYAAIAGAVASGPMGALIGKGLVAALGLNDDYVGDEGRAVFEENYDDPPVKDQIKGVDYTHKFWIDSHGGGDYEVYFRVVKKEIPREEPG